MMKYENVEILMTNMKSIEENKLPCGGCAKNFDNAMCFLLRKSIVEFCPFFESIKEESNFLTPPRFS